MTQVNFRTKNDCLIKTALQDIADKMRISYEDVVRIVFNEYIKLNNERYNMNTYNYCYLNGQTEEEFERDMQFRMNEIKGSELAKILTKEYQDSNISDDHYYSVYLPEEPDIHFVEKFILEYME